jgi:hypothetical protein
MVIYVALKGMKQDKNNNYSNDVWEIYNKLIELVLQHDFLCSLPLFSKTLEQVQKNINKKK